MLKKNETLELIVQSIGSNAEGICRHDNMVVFVAGALPGERITAKIIHVKKNYAYGLLQTVIEPSIHRQEPPCPHFGKCGGCSCQHMTYDYTLAYKTSVVQDCFTKIAKLPCTVQPALAAKTPFYYRNKTAVPVAFEDGKAQCGFYAPRSHRLISVKQCMIAKPQSDLINNAVLQWMERCQVTAYSEETGTGLIRHIVSRVSENGESLALLVINGTTLPAQEELIVLLTSQVPGLVSISYSRNENNDNVILGKGYTTIFGKPCVEEKLDNLTFRISPLSFFQVHTAQAEALYQKALEMAAPKPSDRIMDVYCGAGTITSFFARHVAHADGIEIVPQAIVNAKENAALNGIENVTFYEGEAETILPQLIEEGLRPDLIILDPPRKGVAPEVLQAVVDSGVQKIVYISCHPATQARDAAFLADAGYQIEGCQPVDMFCYTSGIENILLMARA